MAKLPDDTIERNERKLEKAALHLFTRQGYHGTSMREIADAAGVSIGNLYNYYANKDELFSCVVQRYEQHMEKLRLKALGSIRGVFESRELRRLARIIRQIVYDNPDYWRLMYIDVIEFRSRHFADTYRSLATGIKERLGGRLEAATRRLQWKGIDPALAFTAIYLQFFTYFLIEKLFGGRQHLGMSDDRAIGQLIKMATEGLVAQRAGRRQPREKRGRL